MKANYQINFTSHIISKIDGYEVLADDQTFFVTLSAAQEALAIIKARQSQES